MSALREARVVLQPSEEWRFEVDYGSQGIVSLLDGHAEIFGTELIAERRYTFSGVKLAVFTWHGCTLEVEGTFSHQYTAHETPMIGVLQLHEELEQQRNTALATLSPGPRVMVVGSDDCGKTTMCRILANYAARRGHGVTYVDLDVGQQLFGPPGTISATAWHQPLDLELRGEFAAPLAYWLGHHSIVDHIALFRHAIGSMRTVLDKLMRAHLGEAFKHECRMESLRSYFYGIGGQLCPHSTVLSFSSTTLMAIESAPPPPADTLPIGAIAPRHAVRAVKLGVKSWPGMLKAILAVSFAQSGDDENSVLAANIAGIVFVTNVDVENGRVTVLAPSPVAFPGGVLLAGSIKWLEAR
ncbi:Pre-mRNA cleavage complex II protein Clp1-domain-containing protein [Pavlovales sp. CCMP2436]|nr:Pre-mRNA cleavage complex II protein Clp1-domain-containing protein [Pavlovales sp. CCMP2436]